MASAIPGGAPGYDDDKEFSNNITHVAAQTSQRLRGYSFRGLEVKRSQWPARFRELSGVPAVRRVRICCSQPCVDSQTSSWPGIAVRRTASLSLAYVPAIHVFAARK